MSRVNTSGPMYPLHSGFARGLYSLSDGSSFGIDVLRNIDYLFVKHLRTRKEALLHFPAQAKYEIYNRENQQVLFAHEESPCFQRFMCCCAPARRFTLHVFDNSKQEIIQIHREFKFCVGCCWFSYCENCRQEATVEAPPGNPISMITQEGSCCRMHYVLKDIDGTTTFNILGPRCIGIGPCSCCCENKFTIFGTDEVTEIGAIHKKYATCCSKASTGVDSFTYEVPMDLNTKMKAIILGALVVIDFTNFSIPPPKYDSS